MRCDKHCGQKEKSSFCFDLGFEEEKNLWFIRQEVVMFSSMCQLEWTIGFSDSWLNIFSCYICEMFLEQIII